jgi:hypothetical protein
MPPTPTHTSRAGDTPRSIGPHGVELYSYGPTAHGLGETLSVTTIDTYRARIATLTVENHRLAGLLDGVMADDPQAIRDAAAWLTANRPEVDG